MFFLRRFSARPGAPELILGYMNSGGDAGFQDICDAPGCSTLEECIATVASALLKPRVATECVEF